MKLIAKSIALAVLVLVTASRAVKVNLISFKSCR